MTAGQQPPHLYGPPPAKKRRALPWILGGIAAILLLCVGFAALGAFLDDSDPTEAAQHPTATTAAGRKPAAADFKVTAKITEKTCYGEVGCAVTWQPEITYTGPVIADGQTWLISYEVSGIESGTKIGTIVMGSVGPAKQREKHVRTAGENAKIVVKVTGVEAG